MPDYLKTLFVDEAKTALESQSGRSLFGAHDDDANVKTLLVNILRNGVYDTDQSENITALSESLGVTE